jgi:hypothetical protein
MAASRPGPRRLVSLLGGPQSPRRDLPDQGPRLHLRQLGDRRGANGRARGLGGAGAAALFRPALHLSGVPSVPPPRDVDRAPDLGGAPGRARGRSRGAGVADQRSLRPADRGDAPGGSHWPSVAILPILWMTDENARGHEPPRSDQGDEAAPEAPGIQLRERLAAGAPHPDRAGAACTPATKRSPFTSTTSRTGPRHEISRGAGRGGGAAGSGARLRS